jgi:hypothetical protein
MINYRKLELEHVEKHNPEEEKETWAENQIIQFTVSLFNEAVNSSD